MRDFLRKLKHLFNSKKEYCKNKNNEEEDNVRYVNWRYEIKNDEIILAIPSDLNVSLLNDKVKKILDKNTEYHTRRCLQGGTEYPEHSFIECIEIYIDKVKEIEKDKNILGAIK